MTQYKLKANLQLYSTFLCSTVLHLLATAQDIVLYVANLVWLMIYAWSGARYAIGNKAKNEETLRIPVRCRSSFSRTKRHQ
jgi:hypothetical protein